MSFSESDVENFRGSNADGYDADEWGQYRSLSTLAVVALALGLCSSLVLVSPLMMVVPLATVAIACLALKGIAASDGGLSGVRLAQCGLALAILFGVMSVARVQFRDQLLQSQVDQAARRWLSLAALGRPDKMLSLITPAAMQKLTPEGGPTFFGSVLASALVRQDPLVVQVANLPSVEPAHLRLAESGVSVAAQPPQALVRYTSIDEKFSCSLNLSRRVTASGDVNWLIDSWSLQ